MYSTIKMHYISTDNFKFRNKIHIANSNLNQQLQLCTACTVWSDLVIRPVFVHSSESTTSN